MKNENTKTIAAIVAESKTTKIETVATALKSKYALSLNAARKILKTQKFENDAQKRFALKCSKLYDETHVPETLTVENVATVENVETALISTATVETSETVETVETLNETANATETAYCMLSRMKMRDTMPAEIVVSAQYRMKSRAEIVFFKNRREMFVPTVDEIAEMQKIADEILPTLHKTASHVSPNVKLSDMQTDKKTNEPKSAFFLNDYSYTVSVRFSK